MKKSLSAWSKSAFAALAIISISLVAIGAGGGKRDEASSFLSKLRPDQPVIVIERDERFEIRPVENELERSHTIVEVGSDYLLLRDLTEQVEMLVPVYSVKCVTLVKDLQAGR